MSGTTQDAAHTVFAAKARTFHLASRALPGGQREDAALIYAFCRAVDDAVDEVADPVEAALRLGRIRTDLLRRHPAEPLVGAFREVMERRGASLRPALQLIDGVAADLGQVRVTDEAELIRYCYGVASTVGLLMCPVLEVRSHAALAHAIDLGIAMQLTNIARDVAEDAGRGRVYLPRTWLREAGTTPEAVLDGSASPAAVARAVERTLALADRYYASGDAGLRAIPLRSRLAILVASRVYRGIGEKLRRRGCDPLPGRTVLAPGEKMWRVVCALGALASPSILGWGEGRAHDATLHLPLRGLRGPTPAR
jgi:15-cis-phytoene synthase